MQQLEQVLIAEREHTVRELVAWFENQGTTQQERDVGLKKVGFSSLIGSSLFTYGQ